MWFRTFLIVWFSIGSVINFIASLAYVAGDEAEEAFVHSIKACVCALFVIGLIHYWTV